MCLDYLKTMESYLVQAQEDLAHLFDYKTVHVVLGNESADLDSVISSLVEAFYLSRTNKADDVLIIPVINICRRDVHLRKTLHHVLKQQGTLCDDLIYRDDVDLQKLHFHQKLKLTLVDQNILPLKDVSLEDCVVSVIDHRPRERPESSGCEVNIEQVGSCCTLIAEQIFNSHQPNTIDEKVAALLFSTIIFDTINMSKDAKRGTAKDEEILQRLENILPNCNRCDVFEQINIVRYDISGFTSLDILEMDLKVISKNDINIPMSSVTVPIEDLIKRDDFESSLYKLSELHDAKALVILCMVMLNKENVKRDLAVFSTFKPALDKIVDVLCSSSEPSLQLERIPYESTNLTIFSQKNIVIARKKVLPILKSLISNEDFSRLFENPDQINGARQDGELASGGIAGVIEDNMKHGNKYSDSASSLSGTSMSGTDTSTEMYETFSPTTNIDQSAMQIDNAVFVSKMQTKPDAADHNNSHIVLANVDNSLNDSEYNSTVDNMHFLNKQHNVDNMVCMTSDQPLITVGTEKVIVHPEASSGIASPMEIVSDQTSEQGSSYPVTPPNSFMDSNFGSYMKDYHLPSFNSAEMVKRINDKKASLHPYEDLEVCGSNNKNPSSNFPYTPQNSFVESEFDSSFAKSITPDSIEDILGKIDEANNHSRAAINPDYAKRSNGENIGFHCCSDFETETVSEPIDTNNIVDVAYSLANEIIQNSLETYPCEDKLNESLEGEEKRLTPLVKSRSEGTTIDLSIKSECPKSQSDVINLSNVLETDYARQFDPFNGRMEYSHFSLDYADYMAKRGVAESASKISWGSYSDDITVSSESTKSEEGVHVKKSESCDSKTKIVIDSKIKSSNSLPEVSLQSFPKIIKPPESILSSIDDNLSDLTTVSPTKSNLAHDISNSDMEGELAVEEDSDLEDGEKDFAAQLREKLTQIGNNSELNFPGFQQEGIFSPEELKSGIKRMSNLKTSDFNQIANFSAEDLREKLEKIALDENGAVGGLRDFNAYDSDSDSETSLTTLEGNLHANESASLSPRPLSSGLMEIIEENEEDDDDEENCEEVVSKVSESLKSFQNENISLFNKTPLQDNALSSHENIEASLQCESNVGTSNESKVKPEPVVLRRHGNNKEVFHTTAGRISISIDSTAGDPSSSVNTDRESTEEIGILDYKQTHREVGEILARVKSAIMRADAELMLSSSSSLCTGVDACLQSDNKVRAEGLHQVQHKNASSSKLQQCVDHPLAETTDDMKPFQNSENNWHNEDVFIASDLSTAMEDNAKVKNNPQTVSSHENTMSHHANENNIAINDEETRPVRPSTLQTIRPKKKIKPNVELFDDEDVEADNCTPPVDCMLGDIDDLQTPEDLDTPEEIDPEGLEVDWESETPLESPNTIPEYTAEQENADSKHWKSIVIGEKHFRIDMKVVEPYKKILSHGGYMGEDLNAIIVFSGCFLPDRGRKDYNYVMDNLFLYVTSTLEQLVAEDYMIVFFHGATPRRQMPGFSWLKRCYQMIDHRLKKNLKALLLVHPTLWLKTIVMMTRPFISSKFYSKLHYVKTLEELSKMVPMEHIYVPDQVKLYDEHYSSYHSNSTPSTPSSPTTFLAPR
ncbi:protein prune homolog 2 isoform X2 [Octopus bimaculoides]|uniref:protein prune homolog 2 isoform X2 n=1 Tax=Octopus bimaculoides TaxID=37653 RepID=UPI00071C379B|nr:protein prune homolog 2 isoform X2 [Octopus bimaculoides]|eukprot:XP_014789436.1 PREDICTED: protein prune homolog 2-like isoform X2 [Octopus bimaculoides]